MKKIELSYQKNIRDIGGLKTVDGKCIKYGKLIRGGKLSKVSTKDIEILNSLYITDIIDFRETKEVETNPDVKLDNVRYHNYPPFKTQIVYNNESHDDFNLIAIINSDVYGYDYMIDLYKNLFLTKQGINAYKNFFKCLLENKDKTIFWHCSQGKDRAGMAAFLVEYALGVDMQTCMDDYLLTNDAMNKKIKQLTHIFNGQINSSKAYESLKDIFSAKEDYINVAIKSINDNYQSISNFIENILDVDVHKLREYYLE